LDLGAVVMAPTTPLTLLPIPPYPDVEPDVSPPDSTGAMRVEVLSASEDMSRVRDSLVVQMSL
jgi:hypothetical protein